MRASILSALALLTVCAAGALSTAQGEEKTDCAITYTRAACPGQEAESFKKCDGKKTCMRYAPATTVEQCQEAALAACANDRLTVTKSKVISAKFKGKVIKSKSGKDDFCIDYAKREAEFNQCGGK